MANNLIIDEQRKQSRFVDRDIESHHGENEIVEDRSPEAILNQSQRLSTVTKALQELPEKTRDVFCLLRLKQLEKQEVASHLGISVNMVEKHVRKAIEYCQNKLKKSELRLLKYNIRSSPEYVNDSNQKIIHEFVKFKFHTTTSQ